MAYDIFYYGRDGSRLPEMAMDVAEYDTPPRNENLRRSREYAEAVQVDHPARPWHHWNGKEWVEGPFDPASIR